MVTLLEGVLNLSLVYLDILAYHLRKRLIQDRHECLHHVRTRKPLRIEPSIKSTFP